MGIGPRRIRGFKIRTQYRVGKDGKTSLSLENTRSFKDKVSGDKGKSQEDTVRKGKSKIQGKKVKRSNNG